MRLLPKIDDNGGSNARRNFFGSPFEGSFPPPKPEPSEVAASQCKAPEASGTASRPEPAPCDCSAAGYCPRHFMPKDEHLHTLCRTRDDYRALWDRQAAEATDFCGDWIFAGNNMVPEQFQCGKCGTLQPAASTDDLPTNKPCRKRRSKERVAGT